jgi:WD40 repeat protein
MAFSRDGRKLAWRADDSNLRIRDLESGRDLALQQGAVGAEEWRTGALAFSADGKKLLSLFHYTARVWEVDSGKKLGEMRSVKSVAFTPDGNRVISGTLNRSMLVWRAEDGQVLATLRTLADESGGYVVTPQGQVDFFGDEVARYILCRIGKYSAPLQACEERARVHGLLGKVVAGDMSYLDP